MHRLCFCGAAALFITFTASACGDESAQSCTASAVDTCQCDGSLGVKVCGSDSRWGACMCELDGGTDAGRDSGGMDAATDASADAQADAQADASDAAADAGSLDAAVSWPAMPDDYVVGDVARITSLTVPAVDSANLADCCRDWGAISKDNQVSGTDEIDNAFAALAAATVGLGLDLQGVLSNAIAAQTLNILLDHQSFDGDPDPAFVIAALDGVPNGTGGYLVDRATFLPGTGTPRSIFVPASLSGGTVAAGPGTLTLALPFAGVSLDYTFEDVLIESDGVTVAGGITYTTGTISGYLTVDDYFQGINDYVATECGCLGATGDFYDDSSGAWVAECQDQAVVDALCPSADEAGCREVGAGVDCTASGLLIANVADLDTDSSTDGYEALSLGLRFTAATATVTGVEAP